MALLTTDQQIRETYEVEKLIGEGAFAEVYRVRHRFLGRQALKLFKSPGISQDKIESMLGEAILLSRIGHPNIIRVYDANVLEIKGESHGYFTMENVPGGSLDRFWQSFGADFIPVEMSVDLMRQVCRGVALAHSENPPVIHRDIKPQNILVGYESEGIRVRLTDFGLAKHVNPLTMLATAAGTLAFKPPEAFENTRSDSCSADVWAIGVTLYLLLTDKLPFEVDPALGWGNQSVFKQELIRPSTINWNVDKELDAVVLMCLERNPENRLKNGHELLERLMAWTPNRSKTRKQLPSPDSQKSVLGDYTPLNRAEATNMVMMAFKKAKDEGFLMQAADLLEEALNKAPELRDKYASQLRLWRCGISM